MHQMRAHRRGLPALALVMASVLTGCGGAAPDQTAAIKSTVAQLFGALKHQEYAAACAAYAPATQALLEQAARQLRGAHDR